MDIGVRKFSPGEADLTLRQATDRGRALLGARASIYKRNESRVSAGKVCVVAVYADDDVAMPPPCREEVIIGEGASWDEAFARAQESIAKRYVVTVSPSGLPSWFDLASIDVKPGRDQ